MHHLGSTNDGINRAGLDTLGATDAQILMDKGNLLDGQLHGPIDRHLDPHQFGDAFDGRLAARHTFVGGVPIGDGLGVGAAAWIAALASLGLWQQGIEFFHDRIRLYAKTDSRVTQQQAKQQRQEREEYNNKQNMVHGQYLISPVKPMKASDIKPAVIIAMAMPRNGTGTSAAASRSRRVANSINTRQKPSPPPSP